MRLSTIASVALALWIVAPAAAPAQSSADLTPLQPIDSHFCHALAPEGWTIIDQDERGASITLASADQQMKAALAMPAVSSGLAVYGPEYQSPENYAQFLASAVAGEPLQASGPQEFMGMQVLDFQGETTFGFAIYRVFSLANDPNGFTVVARIAVAPSQQAQGIAGAVAATIKCDAIEQPPAGGYAQVQPSSDDIGTSSRCKAGECDDSDLAGTYNVQLGTGYVHSESGQNYLVDPSTDYNETGPDGPGYYRQNGNSLEKLVPGWSQ